MRASPVADFHARADALIEPYGPLAESPAVDVVQTYGPFEAEYAAIRKASGLLDLPLRGTLALTGADRLDFLNRMLTQQLKGAQPWTCCDSFWLNRKGRIDADLRVIVLPDRILLDADIHAVARAHAGLAAFVITEDVAITDLTPASHRLALHGPLAQSVIAALSKPLDGPPIAALQPGQATQVSIAGHAVLIDRNDSTGEVGLELLIEGTPPSAPAAAAAAVFTALLSAAHEHPDPSGQPNRPNAHPALRPVGWAAFNVARIEAGTPLYNIDFGPDSLPAESGVLDRRVSFTKGCYLGQEIVARMHALGKPKQVIVALRLSDPQARNEIARQTTSELSAPPPALARQPVTGAAVYTPASINAWRNAQPQPAPPAPVGAVTSSTLAPMLAQAPIALAMVRFEHAAPGTALLCDCDGALLPAVVRPALRFWPTAPPTDSAPASHN